MPLLVKSDRLGLRPSLVLILAVALRSPHFASTIFGAAGDHFVHQPNVRAPGDVSYPVIMRANFDLRRCLFAVLKQPKVDIMVVSSSDESLGWRLELTTCRCCTLAIFRQNGRLCRRAPAYAIYAALMGNEVACFVPLVIWGPYEDD